MVNKGPIITVLVSGILLVVVVYVAYNLQDRSNCCECGDTLRYPIWEGMRCCSCRGPSSEACHHARWNMSSYECNLSILEVSQ